VTPLTVRDNYAVLFEGNRLAYGTEAGGCERIASTADPIDEWLRRVDQHLDGDTPFGIYPMWLQADGQTVCRWGCVDFDEGDHDSFIHATNLRVVLEQLGATGWVERSRSKGFHVWVFAEGIVSAGLMRRALLGATQVAGGPLREINPKQEKLTPRGDGSVPLGNYVRLPYPNMWHTSQRRCMVDDLGEPIPLERFVNQALDTVATTAALRACEALWQPPKPPTPPAAPQALVGPYSGPSELPGLVKHLIENGPLEQHDRSAWLWRLCRLMAEKHVPYRDAHQALVEADGRWGKFHDRPNGDETLDRMLAKAYGVR
jgi:hypothetical protein